MGRISQPFVHSVLVVLNAETSFKCCGRNFQRPEERAEFGCVCFRRSREGSGLLTGILPHASSYTLTLIFFCCSLFSALCSSPWLEPWGL